MAGRTTSDEVRSGPTAVDVGVAAVFTAVVLANLLSETFLTPVERPLDTWGYTLAGFTAATVVLCRSAPLRAFGVYSAGTLTHVFIGYPVHPGQIALFAVLYFLARRSPSVVLVCLAVLASLVGVVVALQNRFTDTTMQRMGILALLLLPVIPTLIGRTNRANEARRIELRKRLAANEVARTADAERLLAEQRLAIARDLHDTVAHSVATVSVQSGAALAMLGHDPDAAREALRNIRHACDVVIADTQSTLAGLRDPSDLGAPTLKQTAEQARESGLSVQLIDSGEKLPAAVAGTFRRIAQESVSNVLRHSSASDVRIELQAGSDPAILQVEDNGAASEANPTSGNGLRGMNERAALLGGRLEVGPGPNGGFMVIAEIPLS